MTLLPPWTCPPRKYFNLYSHYILPPQLNPLQRFHGCLWPAEQEFSWPYNRVGVGRALGTRPIRHPQIGGAVLVFQWLGEVSNQFRWSGLRQSRRVGCGEEDGHLWSSCQSRDDRKGGFDSPIKRARILVRLLWRSDTSRVGN